MEKFILRDGTIMCERINIFGNLKKDLRDLYEKFGESHVLGSLWGLLEKSGHVTDRIREWSEDDTIADGTGGFNSYPFGVPGKYVYKEFVGLYSSDKPEITIDDILKAARQYYKDTNTLGFKLRSIFIFTDKWDRTFQYAIESKLGELYIKGGLRVIVLLYDDFGIRDIPFPMTVEMQEEYLTYFLTTRQCMRVGEYARTQLKSILEEPNIPRRWIDELQNLEYSRQFFGTAFPIIVPDSPDVDGRRYYANPISICGMNYRITNDWYEKNYDKLKYWVWTHRL